MTDSVHVSFTKYDFLILNLVISQFSDLASFYDLHLSSNLIPKKLNVFYYFDNLFIMWRLVLFLSSVWVAHF